MAAARTWLQPTAAGAAMRAGQRATTLHAAIGADSEPLQKEKSLASTARSGEDAGAGCCRGEGKSPADAQSPPASSSGLDRARRRTIDKPSRTILAAQRIHPQPPLLRGSPDGARLERGLRRAADREKPGARR